MLPPALLTVVQNFTSHLGTERTQRDEGPGEFEQDETQSGRNEEKVLF